MGYRGWFSDISRDLDELVSECFVKLVLGDCIEGSSGKLHVYTVFAGPPFEIPPYGSTGVVYGLGKCADVSRFHRHVHIFIYIDVCMYNYIYT